MTFDDLRFAPILVPEVFETVTASQAWYDKNKIQTRAGAERFPYVSRSGVSNGHEAIVDHQTLPPNPGNAVTIGVDTSTVFYQPAPFYTSVKIQVLRHRLMTPASGLILVTLLRAQMSKFQWGNGVSLDRLKVTHIMVPVTADDNGDDVTDWTCMNAFGGELINQMTTRASSAINALNPLST
ncbi:restriction endonuclease subunit S [Gordonia amicalis]|uniref:restriction endonuclease subunit S n=1 Tax=Gordonia amicalis TaxID=89053 RepID=UPI0022A6637D|nr:restriction endonuclease subunit S [Gordonia amicalis]MCZ0914095.1 restriction endonuclease subunit S [Gordonia amicalis]